MDELNDILNLMGFGYLIIDKDLNFHDANDNLLSYIGHSKEDLSNNITYALPNRYILKEAIDSDKSNKLENIYLKKFGDFTIIIFDIYRMKIKSDVRHLSHEVRNSLNIISSFSEISMMSSDNKEFQDNLQKIMSSSSDIIKILDDLQKSI